MMLRARNDVACTRYTPIRHNRAITWLQPEPMQAPNHDPSDQVALYWVLYCPQQSILVITTTPQSGLSLKKTLFSVSKDTKNGVITSHHPSQLSYSCFFCLAAVCCTSTCPWMASAQLWDHKERYPAAVAAAGGGDKHMCGAPPPITLRWLFSVGDRYSWSIV